MRTWTIGKRITAGFAGVIAIAAGLGLFAYTRQVAIREHSDRIAKVSLPTVELVDRAQRNAKDYDRIVYKHIGSSDKEDMARLEADLAVDTNDNTKIYEQLGTIFTTGKGLELLEKTKAARADYVKIRNAVLDISRQATNNTAAYTMARQQMDPASDRYLAALVNLVDFIRSEAAITSEGIQSAVRSSQTGILVGLVLAVLVGATVGFTIIRGTGKVLNRVAGALDSTSNQVSTASLQVSSSSQTLAEGSSEQAASLEETSSSLEELSSMTKRNSENAQKANELAKQARTSADKGVSDMEAMSIAMEAIKVSSDDIAKIIKTIDEIAFQTNILALNAAVEAARAGDAGMGFAVVADEVRNLAQRSAQAAKETADKIEGAIAKSGQGVEISAKVSVTLNEILARVRQVDELVAEVANASKEQNQGISQINLAVGQMDKVTQSNAASAEERAAAAEELSAQAESMKGSVQELLSLVNSRNIAPAVDAAPVAKGSRKVGAAKTAARLHDRMNFNGNGRHNAADALALSGATSSDRDQGGESETF